MFPIVELLKLSVGGALVVFGGLVSGGIGGCVSGSSVSHNWGILSQSIYCADATLKIKRKNERTLRNSMIKFSWNDQEGDTFEFSIEYFSNRC